MWLRSSEAGEEELRDFKLSNTLSRMLLEFDKDLSEDYYQIDEKDIKLLNKEIRDIMSYFRENLGEEVAEQLHEEG